MTPRALARLEVGNSDLSSTVKARRTGSSAVEGTGDSEEGAENSFEGKGEGGRDKGKRESSVEDMIATVSTSRTEIAPSMDRKRLSLSGEPRDLRGQDTDRTIDGKLDARQRQSESSQEDLFLNLAQTDEEDGDEEAGKERRQVSRSLLL